MNANKNILDLLTQLACNIFDEGKLIHLLNSQPENIRLAILANDSDQFSSFLTKKILYPNEVKVIAY